MDTGQYMRWYDDAVAYGERCLSNSGTPKAMRGGKVVVFKRVNTPSKVPVVYVSVKMPSTKRELYTVWFAFVRIGDGNGTSFFGAVGQKRQKYVLIRSHAIDRYIERHGWDGDREECENRILLNALTLRHDIDRYSGESSTYFDDGLLLGSFDGTLLTIKTYIHRDNMFSNQKVKAKWLELKLQDERENPKDGFQLLTNIALDSIDEYNRQQQKKHNPNT